MAQDRVTVQEAARRLGVKEDAVRKRIQRGTIEHDRDRDGRVYVYLDTTEDTASTEDTTKAAGREELVESLLEQVRYMREQLDAEREANRENRRLLAAALERIPAIEPPETPRAPETASEGADRGTPPDEPETATSRSWWRRFFGFE